MSMSLDANATSLGIATVKRSKVRMTVGELVDSLNALRVPRNMKVVLLCEPEEDMGPCFGVAAVSVERSHTDRKRAVVIEGAL